MSLRVEQTPDSREDLALQALWYVRQAGAEVARRYQRAVDSTLQLLCSQPDIGRRRHFRHPKLEGLRSFQVKRPFHKRLIFYRVKSDALQAVRLIHGARDLPRRLVDAPGSDASTEES